MQGKQYRIVFLLCAGLTARLCAATLPLAIDFNTGALEDFVRGNTSGLQFTQSADGGRGLAMAADLRQVTLEPVTVTPGRKYKLAFNGRVDGDFTVEHNDRAHILTLQSNGRRTAAYEILFYDMDEEILRRSSYGGNGFLLTADWHEYVNVFDVPPEAATLSVRFEPRGRAIEIREVRLGAADAATINRNPDFRYGELNYSGWRPAREGRLYRRPDGRTVFVPGYGGMSPLFPLRDDSTYRLEAKGLGGRVTLIYYGREGNRMASRHLLRPTPEGAVVELQPPEGVQSGRAVMYGVVGLELFRVTTAGDD